MKNDILNFIRFFSGSEDVFLYGCCYWFAFILSSRFGGEIWLDVINNHFITKIDDEFYDVSGVVDMSDRKVIYRYPDQVKEYDELFFSRIVRDCVMKV